MLLEWIAIIVLLVLISVFIILTTPSLKQTPAVSIIEPAVPVSKNDKKTNNPWYFDEYPNPYNGRQPLDEHRSICSHVSSRISIIFDMIDKLNQYHFIAILGHEKSGRTTSINGVIGGLKRGFLVNAGIRWRIVNITPGKQPYRSLAQGMCNVLPEYSNCFPQGIETATSFLEAELHIGRWSVYQILNNLGVSDNKNLLIVIDKFEELFDYYQQNPDYASKFVELLLASYNSDKQHVYIIVVMNSEYYSKIIQFADLPEAFNKCAFLLPKLTYSELRSVIENPLKMYNGRVDDKVVSTLLNTVYGYENALFVVQDAMYTMWTLALKDRLNDCDQVVITMKHYNQWKQNSFLIEPVQLPLLS